MCSYSTCKLEAELFIVGTKMSLQNSWTDLYPESDLVDNVGGGAFNESEEDGKQIYQKR